MTANAESLSPAERIISTLLTHADHAMHGRPGFVVTDPTVPVGARWEPVTHAVTEGTGEKVVFKITKVGKKTEKVRLGTMTPDYRIVDGARFVGTYRKPGLFPEVAAFTYRQIAEVWKLDNEFVARWASYSFPLEQKDMKVALAAFMLVQNRCGEPIKGADGKVAFFDEDYRDVGEAMVLIRRKDNKDLNPKLLLRIGEFLRLPEIAAINRELGFGKSARNPALGRYPKAVEKWLLHREQNPKMLESLVKAGFRTTVMALSQQIGYKPATEGFFRILRWKQKQSTDGRRSVAIGTAVTVAESWVGMGEQEICERIVQTKPNYKRLVGLLPASVGLTPAIMSAAVESGCLSDQDLIILTPTLEDLGLLSDKTVKTRWEKAVSQAENQRALNIASRVKNKDTADKLVVAAETAIAKAVAEVTKGIRIYVIVDISGSMQNAIATAKRNLAKLLGGFPLDKIHVSVFSAQGSGRVVQIKHPSNEGVKQAFRGINAGGGTDYGVGVQTLAQFKPAADEDALFLFVGDEDAHPFAAAVQASGLNPVGFGFMRVEWNGRASAVRDTANQLGIPCFMIDEGIFNDPYAIPRTLRNLIASTPVGQVTAARPVASTRVSLVSTILGTELLAKPVWAA